MASVFGGATKGLAGWAVSSINARVRFFRYEVPFAPVLIIWQLGTPSGEIVQANTAQDSRASPVSISETSVENQNGTAVAAASERLKLSPTVAFSDTDGWDNDEGNDDLIAFDENDGWGKHT